MRQLTFGGSNAVEASVACKGSFKELVDKCDDIAEVDEPDSTEQCINDAESRCPCEPVHNHPDPLFAYMKYAEARYQL